MTTKSKKHNIFHMFYRKIKLNMIKLFRSPGGARKVSLGFALGFGLEMIVISTGSLVYLIFYPTVRLSGGSLPAAIIGNVIGKLTFLPIVLLPFAKKIGEWFFPKKMVDIPVQEHAWRNLLSGDFTIFKHLLQGGLHVLIGMSVFGLVLGVISFFVVRFLYNQRKRHRLAKRQNATAVKSL
ncbi:hypothetical protein FHS19_005512 [Paenibacillus rhizosphaerae]|uniref:DUF2062 domain-containing protein n=1 Tax=Paenibacillus rhizosphaerae TaxID=297318 RepID=A0A839TWB3_9BACL|nr:DUF2062 domain-containing protein [Paenibacillus rhizosphaerae]MBB3130793.1 hypothetical protein [Paenibacillus rhizosphaerae]